MLPTPHDPTPPPGADPSPRQHPTRGRRALPWLASVVALAAIIASCVLTLGRGGRTSPGISSNAPTGGGAPIRVLHVAWVDTYGGQASELDPAAYSDTTNQPIIHLLFDTLVTTDQRLNPELWGADHVNISADGLTYTFHIRAGQSFSDGVPVHASDYAYGITRVLDPCFQSPMNYDLLMIQGAAQFSDPANCVNHAAAQPLTSVVADDAAATLTITLQQPTGYFLAALTTPVGAAVERGTVAGADLGKDEHWTSSIIADATHPTGQGGSGMFYVAQYDTQGNLVLKRNLHWWGIAHGKKPSLTEIDYTIFPDSDQALKAYDASTQYDTVEVPSTAYAANAGQRDLHITPLAAIRALTFNWRTPPFDNADARQAFCLAVNRDALATVLQGTVLPSWHLVPQGMPGYDDALTGIDGVTATSGDLAKARAHWQAYLATLRGAKPPTALFHYQSGSNPAQQFALALVGQWNAAFGAGTVVGDNFVEIGSIIQPPEGSYPASQFAWSADYPDPQDFLSLLYTTFSPYNSWHASVPDADRLMARADITSDPGTRFALYHQAEQLLIQQGAICPIYQYQQAYRVRPSIHGYTEDALGAVPLDAWVEMSIASH